MNVLLVALTILSLPICAQDATTIKEDFTVEKQQRNQTEEVSVFQKVPTKWVKITKKSN